jgi:hypothetical protein
MEEYERYQLDLIVSEYRSRGYVVEVESQLPGISSRFDAVARKESEGKMVLVELVNPNLSEGQIAVRRRAIAETASLFPNALVDFRYIDTKKSAFLEFNKRDDDFRYQQFTDLLKARFPVFNKKPKYASRQMLSLWVGYACLLRGFGRFCNHPDSETASILDLYNSFLRQGGLVPAELTDDAVNHDLFQMYEVVVAATQGAIVDVEYVKQLRGHYQSLRKQAKNYSKNDMSGDKLRW